MGGIFKVFKLRLKVPTMERMECNGLNEKRTKEAMACFFRAE